MFRRPRASTTEYAGLRPADCVFPTLFYASRILSPSQLNEVRNLDLLATGFSPPVRARNDFSADPASRHKRSGGMQPTCRFQVHHRAFPLATARSSPTLIGSQTDAIAGADPPALPEKYR